MITEKTRESVNALSKRLHVRGITKPRMYQLCNIGRIDRGAVNETTGEFAVKKNPSYEIPGRELIFDPGEEDETKANKYIENVVGYEEVMGQNGETVLRKKIESIDFVNGIAFVQPHEYNKLVRLERSNYNESNPFRDKSKVAKFRLVDEEKTIEEKLREKELKADAVRIAQTLTTEESRAYAGKLKMPNLTKAGSGEIKLFLMSKAEEDPEGFIQGSYDDKAKLKIYILDAQKFGIISFDSDKSKWMLNAPIPIKGKRPAAKALITVKADQIPDEALIEHFMENMNSDELRAILEWIKNPQDFI